MMSVSSTTTCGWIQCAIGNLEVDNGMQFPIIVVQLTRWGIQMDMELMQEEVRLEDHDNKDNCYDPGPYFSFSAFPAYSFCTLNHLFPTHSLMCHLDCHPVT